MTASPNRSNNRLAMFRSKLKMILGLQEKSLEATFRSGDDQRRLLPLIDLFHHPQMTITDLTQQLGSTLEQIERTATLLAVDQDRTRKALGTLLRQTADHTVQMDGLQERVLEIQQEMRAVRAEVRNFAFHLGLNTIENAPTNDRRDRPRPSHRSTSEVSVGPAERYA